MKMIAILCALALCNVFTDGLHFLGHEEPVDDASTPPLEGPAHNDNFQDEIVDQADPEFDMVAGADGDKKSVSLEDVVKPLNEQFQEGAPDLASQSAAEKEETEEIKRQMTENLKDQFEHADTNGDGSLDKAEFEAAGEFEGPAPGFEKKKEEEIGTEALTEEMIKEDKAEFDAMDESGNGKVDRSETYNYASKNMPQADVNDEDLDEMFNAADTNGDGSITFEEFEGAGQEIEGDGNEMEKATPMCDEHPCLLQSTIAFKIFPVLKRKKANLRALVTKRMLALKPPLKVMSSLLNRIE